MKYRESVKGMVASAVFLFLVLGVSGCGPKKFYPGEKLPGDEVAVVEIGKMILFMVDDTPVKNLRSGKLALLPGEHSFRATVAVDLYDGRIITYIFNAEAGGKYLFDSDVDMRRGVSWRPWIKDLATGETVGEWN